MYYILDKGIIEKEIIPYLPKSKRGFQIKSDLAELVNSILYKLKTGVHWHLLPVNSLFSGVIPSYKTVLIKAL